MAYHLVFCGTSGLFLIVFSVYVRFNQLSVRRIFP